MAALAELPIPQVPSDVQADLDLMESGLPLEKLTLFAAQSAIDLKLLHEVVIPLRTWKHRCARHQNLTPDEADKLVRVTRVYDHAVRVFGNPEKALRWLTRPRERFEGRSLLLLLRTDVGGRLVDGMLWQIADGMFA